VFGPGADGVVVITGSIGDNIFEGKTTVKIIGK
jgi:hypothetical protein